MLRRGTEEECECEHPLSASVTTIPSRVPTVGVLSLFVAKGQWRCSGGGGKGTNNASSVVLVVLYDRVPVSCSLSVLAAAIQQWDLLPSLARWVSQGVPRLSEFHPAVAA